MMSVNPLVLLCFGAAGIVAILVGLSAVQHQLQRRTVTGYQTWKNKKQYLTRTPQHWPLSWYQENGIFYVMGERCHTETGPDGHVYVVGDASGDSYSINELGAE